MDMKMSTDMGTTPGTAIGIETSAGLRNARRWRPDGWRPVAVCSLGFVLAFGLRYLLTPVLDESLSMLLFALNCIFMACLYGFFHSMVLLAVSIPTALFFFRKPFYMFDAITQRDIYTIVLYTGIIAFTSLIIEWLQRERYAAVLRQRVSASMYQLLIESDQDRRAEQAQVQSNCRYCAHLTLVHSN
jgi:K+-sensing histidine kinase KdpD